MKRRLRLMALVMCLAMCGGMAGSLEAALYKYKYTDLMVGFPNDPGDIVSALTDANQIVGYYYAPFAPNGGSQAYFCDLVKGNFIWLQPIGGDYPNSQAYGINKLGQIVGSCSGSQYGTVPCVWTDPAKAPTMLSLLAGYQEGYACGINDSGLIVGYSFNLGAHACKWTLTAPDQPVDLGTLGGFDSEAHGVNNAGQIVGWASNVQETMRACLWNAGQTTPQDLASSLPDGMIAKVINNQGHVLAADYNGFPFFYWSQATGPINPCSESFTSNSAAGLSDSDQMAGTGTVQQTSKCWYWTPGGGEKDLNQMIANLPPGVTVTGVTLISPKGHILGWHSPFNSCLLTPIVAQPGLNLLLMD